MEGIKMKNKLAIVTGGTRGIGAEISIELKKNGYEVVANYSSNDQSAENFYKKTGIEVAKWDVSNYQQCLDNVQNIEQKFNRNIDILINKFGRYIELKKILYESKNEYDDIQFEIGIIQKHYDQISSAIFSISFLCSFSDYSFWSLIGCLDDCQPVRDQNLHFCFVMVHYCTYYFYRRFVFRWE